MDTREEYCRQLASFIRWHWILRLEDLDPHATPLTRYGTANAWDYILTGIFHRRRIRQLKRHLRSF